MVYAAVAEWHGACDVRFACVCAPTLAPTLAPTPPCSTRPPGHEACQATSTARTLRKPWMGPRTLTCPAIVTCAFRTCRPVTSDTTAANASLFGTRVPAL